VFVLAYGFCALLLVAARIDPDVLLLLVSMAAVMNALIAFEARVVVAASKAPQPWLPLVGTIGALVVSVC
jgi:hypothetical protein